MKRSPNRWRLAAASLVAALAATPAQALLVTAEAEAFFKRRLR